MRKRKGNDYFLMLSEIAGYTTKAAELLEQIIVDYNPEEIDSLAATMHEIEHEADTKLHEIENKLAREFITLIEREDISQLGKVIDDVVDAIEEVVLGLHMFDVRSLRDESIDFAKIIVSISRELTVTIEKLRNFRKSDQIKDHIVEINNLEEQGDKLYFDSIHRLYTDGSDLREVMIWTELFKRMETCCDKCEEVSNIVLNVIMKNI